MTTRAISILAAFAAILAVVLATGCTGRQNPGDYKPGNGDSWTGAPSLNTEQRTRLQYAANAPKKGANQAFFVAAAPVAAEVTRRTPDLTPRPSHLTPSMTLAPFPTINPQPSTINPEEDCGACNTNPTVQYVIGPHIDALEWFQTNTCTGWNIEESVDLIHWQHARMIWSWGKSNVAMRVLMFSTNNPIYRRVAAY